MHLKSDGFLALVVVLVAPAASTDYCAVCHDHTMCKFPNHAGKLCGELLEADLTGQQASDLLHMHNMWRDYAAAGKETRIKGGRLPTAANMAKLTWSGELATVAHRWVLQCSFNHDKCRHLLHMKVGQNLATMTTSSDVNINLTELALSWYKAEVVQFDISALESYTFNSAYGHFSQWIWGTTYKVGCAYSKYKKAANEYSHLLACNYGPSGNVQGTTVYTAGKTCSKCPAGTTCGGDSAYPHLCAADDSTKIPGVQGVYAAADRRHSSATLVTLAFFTTVAAFLH